jgi:hypothetical protein
MEIFRTCCDELLKVVRFFPTQISPGEADFVDILGICIERVAG